MATIEVSGVAASCWSSWYSRSAASAAPGRRGSRTTMSGLPSTLPRHMALSVPEVSRYCNRRLTHCGHSVANSARTTASLVSGSSSWIRCTRSRLLSRTRPDNPCNFSLRHPRACRADAPSRTHRGKLARRGASRRPATELKPGAVPERRLGSAAASTECQRAPLATDAGNRRSAQAGLAVVSAHRTTRCPPGTARSRSGVVVGVRAAPCPAPFMPLIAGHGRALPLGALKCVPR